jgi:hypothetical protein
MTTISRTSFLAEPQGEDRVSTRTLAYVAEATRDSLFDFITMRFLESGLTKARLAKRLGKDAAQVNRLLSLPGNWTIDTCAELLFAIDGSMLSISGYKPLEERAHNHRGVVCLNFDEAPHTSGPTSGNGLIFARPAELVPAPGSRSRRSLEVTP